MSESKDKALKCLEEIVESSVDEGNKIRAAELILAFTSDKPTGEAKTEKSNWTERAFAEADEAAEAFRAGQS
jgi:hypothetical protein